MEQTRSRFIIRYCGAYLLVYFGLNILLVAGFSLLNMDAPSSMAAILAFCASFYPAHLFVKDHDRVPDKSEKRLLGIITLAVISLISSLILMMAIPAFTEEERASFASLSAWAWAAIILLVMLLQYWASVWGFGYMAKSILKKRGAAKPEIQGDA